MKRFPDGKSIYIVTVLPTEISTYVHSLRLQFDDFMANLPVEITLIGSSGVGTVVESQEPSAVFHQLEEIAHTLNSFTSYFRAASRFPNSNVLYLEPAYPELFHKLQNRLKELPIQYHPHNFPYSPHCTINSRSQISTERMDAFSRISVPNAPFLIDNLTVFALERKTGECVQLFQTHLKSQT